MKTDSFSDRPYALVRAAFVLQALVIAAALALTAISAPAQTFKSTQGFSASTRQAQDAAVWYVGVNGQARGPMTEAELLALIESENLPPDTLVWREGFADWTELALVPDLNPKPAEPEPDASSMGALTESLFIGESNGLTARAVGGLYIIDTTNLPEDSAEVLSVHVDPDPSTHGKRIISVDVAVTGEKALGGIVFAARDNTFWLFAVDSFGYELVEFDGQSFESRANSAFQRSGKPGGFRNATLVEKGSELEVYLDNERVNVIEGDSVIGGEAGIFVYERGRFLFRNFVMTASAQ